LKAAPLSKRPRPVLSRTTTSEALNSTVAMSRRPSPFTSPSASAWASLPAP